MTGRIVRHPDFVWRLSTDRVILRSTDSAARDGSELFGAAAAVWIAAEFPVDIMTVAADTGLGAQTVHESVALLLEDGLLIEAPA